MLRNGDGESFASSDIQGLTRPEQLTPLIWGCKPGIQEVTCTLQMTAAVWGRRLQAHNLSSATQYPSPLQGTWAAMGELSWRSRRPEETWQVIEWILWLLSQGTRRRKGSSICSLVHVIRQCATFNTFKTNLKNWLWSLVSYFCVQSCMFFVYLLFCISLL